MVSEWIGSSNIVQILVSFEEVTLPEPDNFDQSITSATKNQIWEKQVAHYVDRLETFEANKKAFYIILWQLCSKLLKTKLMGHRF